MSSITIEGKTITTWNEFAVGSQGSRIVILRRQDRFTSEEALTLAAWLVAVSDYSLEEFTRVYQAVIST